MRVPTHLVANAIRQASPEREISDLRMEYLLYLADWWSCLVGKRIMDAKWQIPSALAMRPKLAPHQRNSISFIERNPVELNAAHQKIIEDLIEKTDHLYMDKLIELIHSTYPFQQETIYAELDIEGLAQQCIAEHRAERAKGRQATEDSPSP